MIRGLLRRYLRQWFFPRGSRREFIAQAVYRRVRGISARRLLAFTMRKSSGSAMRRLNPGPGDDLGDLELVPRPTAEILADLSQTKEERVTGRKADIICFAMFDWSSHSQRPEQLMSPAAIQGHRVFYVSMSQFLPAPTSPRCQVTPIKRNIWKVRLAARCSPDVSNEINSGDVAKSLLDSLEDLQRQFSIGEAIAYVMMPAWATLAHMARERWGWPIVYECMDQWEAIPGIRSTIVEKVQDFIQQCDLLVVTAQPLFDKWKKAGPPIVLAGEAADNSSMHARENSWDARWRSIENGLVQATPRASIVIVTYHQLPITRLCLESIVRNTQHPNYEVIVVDNASMDGTPRYLENMSRQYPQIKAVFNDTNRGFAAANNQGLALATGERLVLLNNDTIVPGGWLTRLLRHLDDPHVGLVGPVTNSIGNEAQIAVPYRSLVDMEAYAHDRFHRYADQIANIHMLAMFCVALRRDTFETIGLLDERFGVGMFEDDDYSFRVKKAGLEVVCALDTFVHHFGQSSFTQLMRDGTYNPLFERNREYYERKWNVSWKPHVNTRLAGRTHLPAVKPERKKVA